MESSATQNLPAPGIGVTALSDPFSLERTIQYVPEGLTVSGILSALKIPEAHWGQTVVLFDGDKIDQKYWSCCRPREGVRMIVRVLPGGGGNQFLRTFLTIAVIVVASYYVGPFAAGQFVAGSGSAMAAGIAAQTVFTAAGLLAINALVPVSQEKFESGTVSSPTLSVSARNNQLKPFGTMPVILGRHRTWPMYAAKWYTELVGRDQYLRLLFVVGYKGLAITELKLGETDLSTYDDVEYEILCGGATDLDQDGNSVSQITMFPGTVDEVALGTKLLGPGTPVVQTTATNADEFSLDLTWPNGLIQIDKSGDRRPVSVSVTIEYRTTGVGGYVTLATIVTSDNKPETIRKGYRYKFPSRGQYDVRITRTTNDLGTEGTNQTYQDDTYLSVFRSFTNENPVVHPHAAVIAMRIRATDQINGVVQNFNCVASSILQDWNGVSWVVQETNNPASIFRAVLEGVANARPLQSTSTVTLLDGTPLGRDDEGLVLVGGDANSRIDLTDLQSWHEECDAASQSFNMVRDFSATLWDTIHDVCAAGRGRPRHINGLWSVVRDIEQTVPRQHFTPRNSWNFSGSKTYINMPHAFRVRFLNEDEGWQNDERIVYDDGYDATGSGINEAAALFETLELTGVTNSDQIWNEGRYHIAVARLRPEIFTFQTDIEHIAVSQGDLIKVMYDSVLVGLGACRIKVVTDNGTHATSMDVDDSMPMASGETYVTRIRHSTDGSSTLHTVDTVPGENTTLTFTTPILLASAPTAGDLILFGQSGLEAMDLLVDSITPQNDLSAIIRCYDAAPGVHTASDGPIPPFDPVITIPPGGAIPVIDAAVSDESVLVRQQDGSLQVRILLSFGFVNNRADVLWIQLNHRQTGYQYWYSHPQMPGDTLDFSIFNVVEGIQYDIRARYVFLDQTFGEWSEVLKHTVIGKTSPPPDVDLFFVERQPDGTREFSWVYHNPPPDIAGFRIKYRLGHSGADWDSNMTDISDGGGLVSRSPWETNQLAAGDYTLCIKAVDTGGRESTNEKCVISTLGDPRIQNALLVQNENRIGFPGVKTDCYVDSGTTYLIPAGDGVWSDLSSETWSTWTEWNFDPVASMQYTTEEIDVGAVIEFDPLVTVTAGGSVVIEEQHNDGGGYTSFAALAGVVSARYIKIRVTITTPDLDGITNMQTILSADTVEEELTDVAVGAGTDSGDFRIPITKDFTLITTVQLALQSVGGGWSWTIEDKSTSLGPHIYVYDPSSTSSPTDLAFSYDAVIKGL